MSEKAECLWTLIESDDFWNTSCGEGQQFMNDGIKENKYRFCPYCGKPIKEIPFDL